MAHTEREQPITRGIEERIRATWQTPYVRITDELGYPVVEKKFLYPETVSQDGIGTKGVYHWQQRTFRAAAIDALAMNFNDLAMARARPYKLTDHVILPEDDPVALAEICDTLLAAHQDYDVAVAGGETSVHDNVGGLEVSISMDGFIEQPRLNRLQPGDSLVGLRSDGLHSNGFSTVRRLFGDSFRSEFVEPTKIYHQSVLELDRSYDIHGLMHITGGAHAKLRRILQNANAFIDRDHSLMPQPIFHELYERGVSDQEMYQTFNCGVGFILSAEPQQAKRIVAQLGPEADIIGEVTLGAGRITIESAFSGKTVQY